MQIVYIFSNVNLPQRVIYNCWITAFTNTIVQGFWWVRVRQHLLPLLIISLYKHGWGILCFFTSLHVEFYLYQKIFIAVIQICHNILNSFQKTWQPKDIYDWPLTCWNYSQIINFRSELEFIIYYYWYCIPEPTLHQLLPIGPCAYSRLLTYKLQNTAGFIEDNNWVPYLITPVMLQSVHLLPI